MGTFKKGDNWYIDYYAEGRRRRKLVGPTKSLAQHALKSAGLRPRRASFLIFEEKIRFYDKCFKDGS